MKTIRFTVLASMIAFGTAAAAQPPSAAEKSEPVKLTAAQLDEIVAGKDGPNGSNPNSNGASGAPGNSWDGGGGGKPPGHTGNPHPSD